MENIESNVSSAYSRNKRNIIIIAAALNILTTPLIFIIDENGALFKIINFLALFAFNLLTFAWCHYDSAERNQTLGVGWRFAIILFGLFALLAYLLKSRGMKKGLISVGKALLVFLGIFVVSVLLSAIFGTILESL